jgi:ATP-dependent Clp protease ATP-binding subunit ClpA
MKNIKTISKKTGPVASETEIQEPSIDETVTSSRDQSPHEDFHQVRYSQRLSRQLQISAKYINDKYLPDKAIDVIDEAGALSKLSGKAGTRTISTSEVEHIVAKIAKIPPQTISQSDIKKLMTLDQDLKKVVFGQDEAIASLVASIKRIRAGMGNPERPVGSFLFLGPTGVGKTEVSKQMAAVMGVKFIASHVRIYGKHTVSRLIGARRHVGFDQADCLPMLSGNTHAFCSLTRSRRRILTYSISCFRSWTMRH